MIIAALFVPERYVTLAAIFVVVSVAGLILTVHPKSVVYKLLTARPVVYVGLISYSLYLWHWSIICLSRWTIGLHLWTLPFQVMAIFGLAALSYHLVETPIRRGHWKMPSSAVVALGLSSLGVAAAITLTAQKFALPHFSGSIEAARVGIVPAYEGRFTHREVGQCFADKIFSGPADQYPSNLSRCGASNGAPLQLIFVGDSHATDLFPVSDVIFDRGVASVLNVTEPNCQMPALPGSGARCQYFDKLLSHLPARRNSVLVLRNNYAPKIADGSLAKFKAVFEPFLAQASAAGLKIVYVLPAPRYSGVGPDSLCSHQWFRPSWAIALECKTGLTEDRGEQLARRRDLVAYLNTVRSRRSDFFVYDPFDALCGSHVKSCTPVRNGHLIYRDSSHLTEEGSELLAPSFITFLRNSRLISRDYPK
jgi:hypothetical protein